MQLQFRGERITSEWGFEIPRHTDELPFWVDISSTKEPFLKEEKLLMVLDLVDRECLCSSQFMTISAKAPREVNYFK